MFQQLEEQLGQGRIKENKDISPYTTLRTKTSAEYYFEAESREDIQKAYIFAKENKIPFMILGGGSNVAITKSQLKGLIVKNLYQKKEILSENTENIELQVSSGYSVGRLVSETTNMGLSGFEHHMGLPGSIGGGIYMNSKWTRPVSYIGDSLLYAYLLDKEGMIKKVERKYFNFAYDYSILQQTKEIVLEAVFKLKRGSVEDLKQKAKDSLTYRHQTQPFGVATAGCFFQNVDGKSAGQMIDKAGLKNYQIGSFVVSDKHANFIINKGEGNPEDLLKLLNTIKQTIKEKNGVELKEEVLII